MNICSRPFPAEGAVCAKAPRQERYLIPGQQEEGLRGEGQWAKPPSGGRVGPWPQPPGRVPGAPGS